MGRSRYKFHESHYPYFITCSVVEGISLFTHPNLTEIVLQSIQYLQKQNVNTFRFSQLKAYKLSYHKKSEYQVWQEGVHPKQISTLI